MSGYRRKLGQLQQDEAKKSLWIPQRWQRLLCDNPLHAIMFILHPGISFADLEVLVVKYYWTHVKHSQVPEPPRGHALAVQDLGDAFDMELVSPAQAVLQCPFCQNVVSYYRLRECPQFVVATKAGLAYCTGKLDHR